MQTFDKTINYHWRRALTAAVIISAFVFCLTSPCRAGGNNAFTGGFVGGVVGGIVSGAIQQQQQQQMLRQQQYYQQQQQYYQQQQDAICEEQHERNLAKKKAQQDKAKEQLQDQAHLNPGDGSTGGPIAVSMKRKDGNLWVPVQINKAVAIDFVVDSGASDVLIPKDVFLTLVRSGTITKNDYIGDKIYSIADGSEVKGIRFRLASLQVGNQTVTNVDASIMPSDAASPLLGLSFLSRFKSWTIDNNSGTLVLTLPGDSSSPTNPPVQVASAGAPAVGVPSTTAEKTPTTAPTATAPAQTEASRPAAAPTEPAAAPLNADNGAPAAAHSTTSALIATAAPTAPANVTTNRTIPSFPANTAYADARESLLALGYEPAIVPDTEKCDQNTDKTCFPERTTCSQDISANSFGSVANG